MSLKVQILLNSWFIANKLSLNVDKTRYSVFGQSGANMNNNILKLKVKWVICCLKLV